MKPINSIKALCLRAAFCILAAGSNQVLANSDELIGKGKKVYNEVAGIGCKTCHGEYAEGDLGVGPFIRGASEGAIRAAVSAVGEMIVVRQAITEEELKAVAAYLEYLGTLQVVRTLSKRGRFVPKTVEVRPGEDLQVFIGGFLGHQQGEHDINRFLVRRVIIHRRAHAYKRAQRLVLMIDSTMGDGDAVPQPCTSQALPGQQAVEDFGLRQLGVVPGDQAGKRLKGCFFAAAVVVETDPIS